MAFIQPVEDGKINYQTSSDDKKPKTGNGSLGKDAFLQLLVAQMKYQDPLQPTDNTQYISQLATFSQLEETQNVTASLEKLQANELVGKQVILKHVNETTGQESFISGKVDYVMHEGGKTYLSVNDQLFSLEDLDTVADQEYLDAVAFAQTFQKVMAGLPSLEQLVLKDEEKLKEVKKMFDDASNYEKQFLNEKDVKKLNELVQKMEEMKKEVVS